MVLDIQISSNDAYDMNFAEDLTLIIKFTALNNWRIAF